jgi:hypothetical protein
MDGVVPWGMFTVPTGPGPPMPNNANPVGHPSFPACPISQVQDLGVFMVWTISLRKIFQYLSRLLRWSNVGLIILRYSGDSRPDDLHRFGSKTTKEILFPSTIKAS